MAITHGYTSTKADPVDGTIIGKTKWNAGHVIAAGTIVNADVNSAADIAVSKLNHGTAYQVLRTSNAGTAVEWGTPIAVGSSPPSSPTTNTLWVDTSP
jgi:hypothetical protein